MLDYKTCKALKDAGFPQEFKASNYYYTAPGVSIAPEFKTIDTEKMVKAPTLEELIDACGNRFHNLVLISTDVWYAENLPMDCGSAPEGFIMGEGKTPESAVANLYLKLKE